MRYFLQKMGGQMHTWRIWYSFAYAAGSAYSTMLSFLPKHKHAARTPKKIIVIYSKFHFNPSEDSRSRPFSQSSSAHLARHIYRACGDAEIIYRDQHEEILDIHDADIVIGIISKSFMSYARKNLGAQKILFAVNCHPLFRIKVLKKEAERNDVTIASHEYISPFTGIGCLRMADEVLMIGNQTVLETFKTYGAQGSGLALVNSGVNADTLVPDEKQLPAERIRILFPATNLDLRKGIFRLMEIWDEVSRTRFGDRLELVVIGQNNSFKNEVDSFFARHQNVRHIEWIDSTQEEYRTLFQSAHIVLGLSLEEGQVGSILDAMATGAVPIITKECGIQIENGREGYLLEKYDASAIMKILESLTDDPEKIKIMRKSVREYIIKNHNWEAFDETLKHLMYDAH